jgi:hypothetical protein
MTNRLRHLIAGLTLTAATATGLLLIPGAASADTTTGGDTTATTQDTHWGTPADDPTPSPIPTSTDILITPLDTHWG